MRILITGASRGIGRAAALALAAPGRHLTLAARSAGALAAAAAEARAAGATAEALACDVTAEAQVVGLAAVAAGPAGRLDVVVHSVGGPLVAPLEELTLEGWEASLRDHLTSAFLVCRHTAPLLGRGGLIVLVASVAARQAFPGWSAYVAAKHGVLGFAGAIREELRPRGVRVTAVLPAATDTGLWDGVPGSWERASMLRAEDVGRAIARLADDPAYVGVEELSLGHVAGRL